MKRLVQIGSAEQKELQKHAQDIIKAGGTVLYKFVKRNNKTWVWYTFIPWVEDTGE